MGSSTKDRPSVDTILIECCSCSKVFDVAHTADLASHYRRAHMGGQIYICPLCPGKCKYFSAPGKAKSHVKTKHAEQAEWALDNVEMQVASFKSMREEGTDTSDNVAPTKRARSSSKATTEGPPPKIPRLEAVNGSSPMSPSTTLQACAPEAGTDIGVPMAEPPCSATPTEGNSEGMPPTEVMNEVVPSTIPPKEEADSSDNLAPTKKKEPTRCRACGAIQREFADPTQPDEYEGIETTEEYMERQEPFPAPDHVYIRDGSVLATT